MTTTTGGRPRLILHLGWDETTGQALQTYLAGNFALLRERGILYPATGRTCAAPAAHGLLRPMFDGAVAGDRPAHTWPRERDEVAQALLAEVRAAGVDTVIVSTHDLARLDESDVAAFGKAFAEFELAPVVVIRAFPAWLSQRYGSMVLAGTVSTKPSAGMLERGFYKRLAAWAAIAEDGRLCVIDADSSPTGSVIGDLLSAFAVDAAMPAPPADPDPPADPIAPAIVALVRDFRARGIEEASIQGLVKQLTSLNFIEHQTNVPAPLAAELTERYTKFFSRLRRAPFVNWLGTASAPQQRAQPPIHLADPAGAVFALGRALDARG